LASSPANQEPALRDEELLALMTNGDEQALGMLYDRYGRLVYTIALRVTGDRLSAEEITQDVFQIVWQQCDAFRASAGTVVGWMIGITRHRAIDEIRSRRHKSREREVSAEDAGLDALGDGSDVEQQAVLRGDVRNALDTLPAAQRQALELAYYGGLTCTEIATSLGTSVGTVKTRLRLGLVKLRTLFLPGGQADETGEARALDAS
jgi:RNA polymerase sigma-70 factor (ECF subfamily)